MLHSRNYCFILCTLGMIGCVVFLVGTTLVASFHFPTSSSSVPRTIRSALSQNGTLSISVDGRHNTTAAGPEQSATSTIDRDSPIDIDERDISLSEISRYGLNLLIAVSDNVSEDSFPTSRNDLEMLLSTTSERISSLTREIGAEAYIKTVKFLLPAEWQLQTSDKLATFESFSDANVIIDDPNEIYDDTPYTKQTGGCMEEGEYVHITPGFLNKAVSASITGIKTDWGRPEDVIVHELFHQLFGVFDEYQEGRGKENAKENKGNVCPKNTTGKWILPGREGTLCPPAPDRTDQCVFKPDDNNISQSIMGYIHLNTTTHICTDPDDEHQTYVSHNGEANTKHNRKCNSGSVASVIREKLNSSFKLADGGMEVVYLRAKSKRKICLVVQLNYFLIPEIRKSLRHSMQSYSDDFLNFNDEIGLVVFGKQSARVISNLTPVGEDPFRNLNKPLPVGPHFADNGHNETDGYCIGVGIQKARNVRAVGQGIPGLEILVITNGHEQQCDASNPWSLRKSLVTATTVVHTLLVLNASDTRDQSSPDLPIVQLTRNLSGTVLPVYLSRKENAKKLRLPIKDILSRKSKTNSRRSKSIKIKETKAHRGSFFADPLSMSGIKFGIMGDHESPVELNISLPNSTVVHYSEVVVNEEIDLPDYNEAGLWTYSILSAAGEIRNMLISIKAESKLPWTETIKARTWTNVTAVNFAKAITAPLIYAEVTRGYLPVLDAQVTAVVTTANGTTVRLPLRDTGKEPDENKDDGIYTSFLTHFDSDGHYSIAVEVGTSNTTRVNKKERESGAFNPNNFGIPDSGGLIPLLLEEFERYATTPDISVDNVPPGGDLFPPSPVTDLELYKATDGDINLKFTPPGDDLNIGDASGFVVYFAYDPIAHEDYMNVLDNHTYQGQSPTMYTSNQKIKGLKTNSTHTTLYFTIRFFDELFKYAPFSNIVSYKPSTGESGTEGTAPATSTFRPTTSSTVTILPLPSPPGLSSEVIIALASCSLVAILIISVTVVICIWLRKRKSPKKGNPSPETQPPPAYDIAARWNPRYDPSDPSQGSDGSQPYSGSQGSQESRPHNGRHEYGSQNSIPNTGTEPSLQGYEPPDFPGGSGYEFRPPDRNPPGLYDYNQHISLSPVPEDDPWQPSHVPVTTSRPSHPKFPAPPPPQTRHQTSNPPLPRKDGRKSTNQANRDLQSQMLSPMPFAPGLNQSPSQQPTGLPPWDDEYDQMDPDDIYHEIRLRESLRTEVYQRSVGEIKRFIHSKKNSPGHHSSSGGNGHQPRRDNRISRSSFFAEEGITDDIALPQFDSLNKEPLNMSHGNYSKGNRYGGGMGGYP